MRATSEIPDDPALPGLEAIRALGLAIAIPALGLEGDPVGTQLVGYTPRARATLQVQAGARRVAVKAYADDPAPEAELFRALAAAGLAGDSGPRVPPLLVWEPNLRVLVLGWLEGPTVHELVKGGQGARAGELAAQWMRCVASLSVRLGPPLGSAWTLYRAGEWIGALAAADPGLAKSAKAVVRMLAGAQPRERAHRLVHGTLYARHVLDMGDGPGVLDWERFGQGPLELDAGMLLATIWRLGLDHAPVVASVERAEAAFLTGTSGTLDERALAWHRAAALLRLASKVHVVQRRKPDWVARAHAILSEATRWAEQAARRSFAPHGAALELVLQALSTRPATPEELDEIRRLLT